MELSLNLRSSDVKGMKVGAKSLLSVVLSVLLVFSSFAIAPLAFEAVDAMVTGGDVTPEEPVVTPDEPVVTPDEPVVTPDEPVVTPDEPVVTPDEPVVTPDEPVVTPDEPVVTPDEPVVTPDEPVVTPDEPVVTPDEPDVTPDDPEDDSFFTDFEGAFFNGKYIIATAYYTAQDILDHVTVDGAVIKDADGNIVDGATALATGMYLELADGRKISIVVLGDVDGDGRITAKDARLALRESVDLEVFSEMEEIAANVDLSNAADVLAPDARAILRASVDLDDHTAWLAAVKGIMVK